MGLKFLERDERIAYISEPEAIETYKRIKGITDMNQLPCVFKKGKCPAVLVIDEQYAFTSEDSVGGAKGVSDEVKRLLNGMVENTKVLLDAARKKHIPIFYFYLSLRKDRTDGGVIGEMMPALSEICREGTKMTEIDDRIKPHENDYVIMKKTPSAFFGTPLDSILKYLKIDVNIVVGNSTSGCVRASAYDSAQNVYYTVIPEDCVADRNICTHKANLFDLMTKYADVVPLADVLDWIDTLELNPH